MDEAAAAARDAANGDEPGANAMPSASADNASTMATVGTAPAIAPWQADEAADENAFTADIDVDIGMPESNSGPAAGETPVAAPAVTPVPAGSAKAKGPSRRPTSPQVAPYHDALTSYRELFDKAKCGPACCLASTPHTCIPQCLPAPSSWLLKWQRRRPSSELHGAPLLCGPPHALCCGSRWHAGSMDDRVAARVTGVVFAGMEPLAEEIGPAFQPPTQVQSVTTANVSVSMLH